MPKVKSKYLIQVAEDADKHRRVAWAKYYEIETENDRLRWMVRLLVKRILFHKRLHRDDDLVTLALELELSV